MAQQMGPRRKPRKRSKQRERGVRVIQIRYVIPEAGVVRRAAASLCLGFN